MNNLFSSILLSSSKTNYSLSSDLDNIQNNHSTEPETWNNTNASFKHHEDKADQTAHMSPLIVPDVNSIDPKESPTENAEDTSSGQDDNLINQ
eukprot:10978009-Ditylum_brightwellii.AAC.1